MKIFVCSADRPHLIAQRTLRLLKNYSGHWRVCIHDPKFESGYLSLGGVPADRLIVHNTPRSLAHNRNWILDNLVDDNEWVLMLVDDIRTFYVLPQPFYAEPNVDVTTANSSLWGKRFNSVAFLNSVFSVCRETADMADSVGARYAGFSAYGNPLFRAKKWKLNCFVDGRAILVKKSPLRFDVNVATMDDYSFTAQNLKEFGSTLVNCYVEPLADRYTPGGYGTYDQRLGQKMADCKYLIEKYPGLFDYNNAKKTGHPQAELRFVPRGEDGIKVWRSKLLPQS